MLKNKAQIAQEGIKDPEPRASRAFNPAVKDFALRTRNVHSSTSSFARPLNPNPGSAQACMSEFMKHFREDK